MRRSHPPLAELAAVAHAAADAARPEALRYFRNRDLAAENKQPGGFDPVTEADRAAERAMRRVLAERRPDDAVLGEELGSVPGRTGLTWVLDPIDGTRAFLAGACSWGILVAVADADGPFLGLIDQPYIGERFFGSPEEAWVSGPAGRADLATRDTVRLSDAILMTTFPEIGSPAEGAAFRKVSERVKLTRYGLDCYAYGLLAAGHVDLVIEAGLAPYDIHAPMAVVEAAGGMVSGWRGEPAQHGGRVIAAANPSLHRAALDLLADTQEAE